jgi:hypothetical protein
MKSFHYFSLYCIFFFIIGWGIGGWIEKKNSSSMYEYPSVCEVLGKNHPECK